MPWPDPSMQAAERALALVYATDTLTPRDVDTIDAAGLHIRRRLKIQHGPDTDRMIERGDITGDHVKAALGF